MNLIVATGNFRKVMPFNMSLREWKRKILNNENLDFGEPVTEALEEWTKEGKVDFGIIVVVYPEGQDEWGDWSGAALTSYYLANAGKHNLASVYKEAEKYVGEEDNEGEEWKIKEK